MSPYTSKSNPPSKNVLQIDSSSGWGCISCPGGALAHFPCKLRLKIFFAALGGAGAPTAPPGYAYEQEHADSTDLRQSEFGPDPAPGKFQTLMRTSLSGDTSMMKFS